ncbi:glycoside hydrolase family 3 protein [Diaminobutyricibacter tongyongensis]|uniref:Glycoside hydrolase family 3 protein n=2 Tax=Leifsonia tongyongensis TaxID=1268043 RepID=A0A6L9XYM3_9MICO|nr:glycoside hydrolase family 3 N-terminal domain-containing protein [Diaminobutyricibacter tongyongensis]NEN06520.1 glycoside hydrolase family 3 protein [Diaminobutyricibacter tongyongensis]
MLAGCASPRVGTAPATPSATTQRSAPDPVTVYAESRLASMTLRQKVASLLMLHRPGVDGAALRAFVERYELGGLILMGDNIPQGMAALRAETDEISPDPGLPVLTATDEEGGIVRRLPEDSAPGAEQLKQEDPDATRAAFAGRAALLKQAGISLNFGTVADVTADPKSFIYDRVLGATPADASSRVAASVAGQKGAVLSTLKHFPGHGEVEADSHVGIPTTPVSLADWRVRDEPPFVAGVKSGADVVMFGHLVYSAVDSEPASLSAVWHRILADDVGFNGVTVTDDLRMLQDSGLPQYQDPGENAVKALAAGNTMLLFVLGADPSQDGVDPDRVIDAVVSAVSAGRIPLGQIDEDALKLLELRRSVAVGGD